MRILMGLVFYPRGGSAQVVRYLSRALHDLGHDVHLVVGTLRDGNPEHSARAFYGDLRMTEVDYTEAWEAYRRGQDPMAREAGVPFHPSYEDKPDVPDRSFLKVGHTALAALVDSWKDAISRACAEQPDVLHLHHLNHLHFAAANLGIPAIAHLHGTELKMLEDTSNQSDLAERWRQRLVGVAHRMQHFVAISPDIEQRAVRVLGVDVDSVTTIANGVDLETFQPLALAPEDELALLRRILVDAPRGWAEGADPGSIRYEPRAVEAFRNPDGSRKPILIFVGRFLGFKRVPLLMEAIARANAAIGADAYNILVWGGMPGEWEGEHPHTAAMRLGLSNVFFCGWLPHDILARGLNLADVFVAPSHFEPFGQVFVEAMATGLPCIGTRSGGPLSFVVTDGPEANGWLAEVDNVESLAETICAAVTSPQEREKRGRAALQAVRRDFGWPAIAERFVEVYHACRSR